MSASPVAQVRSFNRAVTERIGALETGYLGRGRPLGEARLLWEIGRSGADVCELRQRLGLDSGYASRLLRSLEAQGFVTVEPAPADRRVRRARLTKAGLAERRALDRLSDELAASMLEPLDEAQRSRLVAAMAEVERLLLASSVTIDVEDPGTEDARWCIQQYFGEIAARFENGFDPGRSLPLGTGDMSPPNGVLLLARRGEQPLGCGALKLTPGRPAYLKRMWVAPGARGLGLGRRLLRALEQYAQATGAPGVQLETNRALSEAIAIYRRAGYTEVEPFNDEPYAHHWFEKRFG